MSKIKFYEITESQLPIEGEIGALYFTTDTLEMYKTLNDLSVVKYTDIIIFSLEQQRTSLFAPLNNKFYYVKETKSMWFYDDEWILVSSSTINDGSNITLDTTSFNKNLNSNVNTVQKLAEAIDNLSIVDSSADVTDIRINMIDMAIELETLKNSTLTGVDSNIVVETFINTNDITLLHGTYDSVNKKVVLD